MVHLHRIVDLTLHVPFPIEAMTPIPRLTPPFFVLAAFRGSRLQRNWVFLRVPRESTGFSLPEGMLYPSHDKLFCSKTGGYFSGWVLPRSRGAGGGGLYHSPPLQDVLWEACRHALLLNVCPFNVLHTFRTLAFVISLGIDPSVLHAKSVGTLPPMLSLAAASPFGAYLRSCTISFLRQHLSLVPQC